MRETMRFNCSVRCGRYLWRQHLRIFKQHILFLFVMRSSVPFDWQNPIGYLVAFVMQYISMFCVSHAAGCHTAFISASCWIFISMAKDIKQELKGINKIGKSNIRSRQFLDRLSQLVTLHAQAKRFDKSLKQHSSGFFYLKILVSLALSHKHLILALSVNFRPPISSFY